MEVLFLKFRLSLIHISPFAALAFKIATDPFVGKLAYFRVYSGKVEANVGAPQVAYRETIRKEANQETKYCLLYTSQ